MEWQGSEVHFGAGHGDTHPYSRDSDSRKFPWVWGQPMGAKWNPAFKNYKTPAHGGRGRLISESLRPTWFAYQVPVQPELHSETLSCHCYPAKLILVIIKGEFQAPTACGLWFLLFLCFLIISLPFSICQPKSFLPCRTVTFHPCFLSYSSFQICLPIGKKDGRRVWGLIA